MNYNSYNTNPNNPKNTNYGNYANNKGNDKNKVQQEFIPKGYNGIYIALLSVLYILFINNLFSIKANAIVKNVLTGYILI